jgi:ArsR family transcriptional regulator, arsenate/arsenite/antimonite-responsive transcriptional repressor
MTSEQPLKLGNYLKAISDENRLAILGLLKRGPLCVCEIFPALNIPQNLTSHHLKVLRDSGLVVNERNGTKIIYYRNKANIEQYQKLLAKTIE